MERHREISRSGGETGLQRAAEFARAAGFETEFVGYAKTEVLTQLGALEDVGDGLFLSNSASRLLPGRRRTGHRCGLCRARRRLRTRAELVEAYRFGDDQALLCAAAALPAATA